MTQFVRVLDNKTFLFEKNLCKSKYYALYPFKRQPHKMVKYTHIIRRQFADELLEYA